MSLFNFFSEKKIDASLIKELTDKNESVNSAAAERVWAGGSEQLVIYLKYLKKLDDDNKYGVVQALIALNTKNEHQPEFLKNYLEIWCNKNELMIGFANSLIKINNERGNFLHNDEVKQIGETCNKKWGFQGMKTLHRAVTLFLGGYSSRDLEVAWHKIGQWLM